MRRGFIPPLIVILIAVTLFSGGFYYQKTKLDTVREERQSLTVAVDEVEEIASPVTDVASIVRPTPPQPAVVAPEPLRGPVFTEPAEFPGDLSVAGILAWTNEHRAEAGMSALVLDTELSAAATIKVEDMFDRQYFAHESPTGEGPSDLADQSGYEFIIVGENLALGSYEDDEDLVQAWMDSPGHKANILHDRYTEMGIAVMYGVFEGDELWLAVQEFGLPREACPEPSDSLNSTIESNQKELVVLDDGIRELQDALEDVSTKFGPTYNNTIRAYNDLVEEYNDLVKDTKDLVDQYNVQVNTFNACASG